VPQYSADRPVILPGCAHRHAFGGTNRHRRFVTAPSSLKAFHVNTQGHRLAWARGPSGEKNAEPGRRERSPWRSRSGFAPAKPGRRRGSARVIAYFFFPGAFDRLGIFDAAALAATTFALAAFGFLASRLLLI